MSNSLRPHESQHARPPCPSPTPGVHWDSRPLSQWCHPAISSSVVPFSSCPQSLPACTYACFRNDRLYLIPQSIQIKVLAFPLCICIPSSSTVRILLTTSAHWFIWLIYNTSRVILKLFCVSLHKANLFKVQDLFAVLFHTLPKIKGLWPNNVYLSYLDELFCFSSLYEFIWNSVVLILFQF